MRKKTDVLLIDPAHAIEIGNQISHVDAANMVESYTVKTMNGSANIAVIPIHGYLAHRSMGHYPGYYTGYGFIDNAVTEAENDPNIDGVIFDINSGGGMVSGAFESAALIRNMKKPNVSIVDDSAYSAAYLLASATGHIFVAKTGGVGSIGVVTMHVDMSKAVEEAGYKITMLFAGDHKVDGNPYEALGADVKQRIESKLDVSYNLFVDAVATGRNLDTMAIKNTEAATFQGDGALEVGLVDTVMSPLEAYTVFAEELSKGTYGGINMAQEQTQVDASNQALNPQGVTTPVVASTQEAAVTVDAVAMKQEGAVAERTRIQGITTATESEGRKELASHLAYDTAMSVEDAIGIMAKSAKEPTVEGSSNHFDTAMNGENPGIEASDSDSDTGATEMSAAEQITADLNRATGIK
jgi:signal peptide peptidase SppA